VISRVAGTGSAGNSGDNGPATDAQLNGPVEVAVTPDGGFLIADYDNHTVRKVSSAGVITRVAGTGSAGNSGDDGPATDAQLNHPAGVAVTPDDGFLIADYDNHTVRKVSSAGVITRVAGTGSAGNSGDDGPATDAQLNHPAGVAVTPDDGFLIADYDNHTVRKVSSAGVISRVAGTGSAGNSGDDGPATDAQLNHPAGVAVTPDGGFLIADEVNNAVRKVSSAGVITRVAGTGSAGNSGDDGQAADARLRAPAGVTVTHDGGFLIADTNNNEVRKVSSAGVITRVAGTGSAGNSGDDGSATEAQLNSPSRVALTHEGGFLIPDTSNNEVRNVVFGRIRTTRIDESEVAD
jgi:trimeric autotransporter adhesin